MSNFEVTTEAFKHCHLIKAQGRIDSQTAPDFAKALDALLDEGIYKIVVDLAAVDFVSSAGLRVLIETQKKCKQLNRGELVLAAVPERIYEALDLAGFVPLFTLMDDAVHGVGYF